MYILESKIEGLSHRLDLFSDRNSSYSEHIDTSITEDNLKNNIVFLIVRTLLAFTILPKATLLDFETVIENYNKKNSQNLSSSQFLSKYWVRIINGYIILPSSLSHILWAKHTGAKTISIPIENTQEIECLYELYLSFYNTHKLTVTEGNLSQVVGKDDIDLLLDRKILIEDINQPGLYQWNESTRYTRYLRNEICALLWITISEEKASNREKAIKLASIILDFNIDWPEQLNKHLDRIKLDNLREGFFEALQAENDLINANDSEFKKSWLDFPQHSLHELFDKTPNVKIDVTSSLEIIQRIDLLKRWFHGLFDYDETRSLHRLLLRFVIRYDQSYGSIDFRYCMVSRILNDTTRPYLLHQTYWIVKNQFQQIIPYLILNLDLAPLAFLAIDEVDFNKKLAKEDNHYVIEPNASLLRTKTEIWEEAFDVFLIKLSSEHFSDHKGFNALFWILYNQAQYFYTRSINSNQTIHFEQRKRFEYAINKLSEFRSLGTVYSGVKPRIFPVLLKPLFEKLKNHTIPPFSNSYILLDCGGFELAIQLFKMCSLQYFKGEVADKIRRENYDLKKEIADYLYENVNNYFSATEILVLDVLTGDAKSEKPKWGMYPFGFDILDWGYCYLYLFNNSLLDSLIKNFEKAIIFEAKDDDEESHDQNNNQYEKIRLFIKSLSCAIIQLNQAKVNFQRLEEGADRVLSKLYETLERISLLHCVDNIQNNRINAFNERFRVETDIYYQSLVDITFKAINYQEEDNKVQFLQKFIKQDKNLARLLSIANLIDGVECRNLLSKELQSVSLKGFIDGSRTTTEWQDAMIEAINSHDFYHLALPLMTKLEQHLEKVKIKQEGQINLLFEVKLAHAFKNKDLEKLLTIQVPPKEHSVSIYNKPMEDRKKYFIGLAKTYNNKDFEGAVTIFETLYSDSPSNVEYAYRLFHARTMFAKQTSDSIAQQKALEEWSAFWDKLSPESRAKAQGLEHNILSTSIHHFYYVENFSKIESSIERLPVAYLYDEEVAFEIYDSYIKRGQEELGISYLTNAKKYYLSYKISLPKIFEDLYNTIDKTKLIGRLKFTFNEIFTLPPSDIVKTIPFSLNGRNELSEFILVEIVRAGKILIEKIRAVDQISFENKYNDLLQSILRFRFAIWCWSIQDQNRVGKSNSEGGDLGSSDFLIQASGDNIALIEALILESKNQPKTEEHITKCNNYLSYCIRFYIVTYYKGPKANFEKTWESYQKDVNEIKYAQGFTIVKSFQDITMSIPDIRNIKVGLTKHEDDIVMYHIFLNLSFS